MDCTNKNSRNYDVESRAVTTCTTKTENVVFGKLANILLAYVCGFLI